MRKERAVKPVHKVAVIGLGVGYSVACLLAHSGYEVTGIDVNPKVVASPRRDGSLDTLLNVARERKKIEKHLILTTDDSRIAGCDLAIVCVNTGDEKKLILGNVENATRTCLERMRHSAQKPIILVYSTLPFGSSKRIKQIFDEEQVVMNDQVGYCYMPLMIAQSTTAYDFVNPPFLAFGSYNHTTGTQAMNFYLKFMKSSKLFDGTLPYHVVTSPEIAELAKLTANAFLSTKISYANMVGKFCEAAGIDGNEVLEIIGTFKHIGTKMLSAGYSFGGACLPRDLESLVQSFEEQNIACGILRATKAENDERLLAPLKALAQIGYKGKVLVLGKTYKAGVKDTRAAGGTYLTDILKENGYEVLGYDHLIDEDLNLRELIRTTDARAAIITTRDAEFARLGTLVKGTTVDTILDFANILDPMRVPSNVRLFKAGMGWLRLRQ